MIIFLYGSDSFRSREKLDEIIEHYKNVKKSALNLISINATEDDFVDFYHHVQVSSMFAQTKLVVVKNLFSSKPFQENFLEQLDVLESLKDIIVVYESEAPDQRLKLYKALLGKSKAQEFSLLEGASLRAFVQKKFEGYKINLDALACLVNLVGSDLWQMDSEIKKLIDFKNGVIIRKDDVELLVKPKIEGDIFKTIDALAVRDKKQALTLIQKHLQAGDAPLYILSMMAFGFKNLLVVKELASSGLMYNSIIQKSKLHPFVVKKSYAQCSQFSLQELKEIYRKIFICDTNIKTGKLEPELALELLVTQI